MLPFTNTEIRMPVIAADLELERHSRARHRVSVQRGGNLDAPHTARPEAGRFCFNTDRLACAIAAAGVLAVRQVRLTILQLSSGIVVIACSRSSTGL